MYLLAFDTSLNKTYIALGCDGQIVNSQVVESKDGIYHSEFLTEKIKEILSGNSLKITDIGAVVTNVGPGSFTGIRTCNTVARMLGQQLDVDVVGVSSLEILSSLNDSEKESLCLMDARKHKAYAAIYSGSEEMLPPSALDLDDAIKKASDNKYFVIADTKISAILKENGIESLNYEETNYDLGRNLLKLGYEHLKRGGNFNFALLKPLYIQPPSITMPKSKN